MGTLRSFIGGKQKIIPGAYSVLLLPLWNLLNLIYLDHKTWQPCTTSVVVIRFENIFFRNYRWEIVLCCLRRHKKCIKDTLHWSKSTKPKRLSCQINYLRKRTIFKVKAKKQRIITIKCSLLLLPRCKSQSDNRHFFSSVHLCFRTLTNDKNILGRRGAKEERDTYVFNPFVVSTDTPRLRRCSTIWI